METDNTPVNDLRIIRFPEVVRKTGLSRSELYNRMRSGDFPAKVPLGPRTVGFVEQEVDDYLSNLIRSARNQPSMERT